MVPLYESFRFYNAFFTNNELIYQNAISIISNYMTKSIDWKDKNGE